MVMLAECPTVCPLQPGATGQLWVQLQLKTKGSSLGEAVSREGDGRLGKREKKLTFHLSLLSVAITKHPRKVLYKEKRFVQLSGEEHGVASASASGREVTGEREQVHLEMVNLALFNPLSRKPARADPLLCKGPVPFHRGTQDPTTH